MIQNLSKSKDQHCVQSVFRERSCIIDDKSKRTDKWRIWFTITPNKFKAWWYYNLIPKTFSMLEVRYRQICEVNIWIILPWLSMTNQFGSFDFWESSSKIYNESKQAYVFLEGIMKIIMQNLRASKVTTNLRNFKKRLLLKKYARMKSLKMAKEKRISPTLSTLYKSHWTKSRHSE